MKPSVFLGAAVLACGSLVLGRPLSKIREKRDLDLGFLSTPTPQYTYPNDQVPSFPDTSNYQLPSFSGTSNYQLPSFPGTPIAFASPASPDSPSSESSPGSPNTPPQNTFSTDTQPDTYFKTAYLPSLAPQPATNLDTTDPPDPVVNPTSLLGNQEEVVGTTPSLPESPTSPPQDDPADTRIPGDLHSRLGSLSIGKYVYCIYSLSADGTHLESMGCEPEAGDLKKKYDQVRPGYILYRHGDTLFSITNYNHLCEKPKSDGSWNRGPGIFSGKPGSCELATALDNVDQFRTPWKLMVSQVFPASGAQVKVVYITDSELERTGQEYNIPEFKEFKNPFSRAIT